MVTGKDALIAVGTAIYGENFEMKNEQMTKCYKACYEHFSQPKRRKGVLVFGSIGVGKSALFQCMQSLFKDTDKRFRKVTGYQLKDLSETMPISDIKNIYGYQLKCDLYIDDIGIGIDVRRYGNTVNIISEILMERYDLFVSSGFKTHLSSNVPTALKVNENNIPTIETLYGKRVLDRVKEMCDVIIWKGGSLRG